ncbi:hypothetical protein CGZ90_19480, partial [Fictibacillus aquaticus]
MKKMLILAAAGALLLGGCGKEEMKKGEAAPKSMGSHSPRKISNDKNTGPDIKKSETAHKRPKIETIGFLEPIEPKQAIKDLKEAEKHLSYVAMFSYQVKKDGSL